MLSDEYVIELNNVSKCYQVYDKPIKKLKEIIFPRKYEGVGRLSRVNCDEFWALQNISFKLKKGETVGIVGKNGSGKSTLLQIITGTLAPTSGQITVKGRIAALLELGAGFNPNFTGRENIYLNASLLGLAKHEIETKIDAILAFADIGHFIDSPVRTYSSGMTVRLAFAIQAQIEPDILIVDEALAVGDAKFQAKCFNRLRELKKNGTSILLVTHATEQIVTHCDHAILLQDGLIMSSGHPNDIVNQYLDSLFGKEPINNENKVVKLPTSINKNKSKVNTDDLSILLSSTFERHGGYNPAEYRWGDQKALITDYYLTQNNEDYPTVLTNLDDVNLLFKIEFSHFIFKPIFGFSIKTKEGVLIYNTNTELQDNSIQNVDSGRVCTVSVILPVRLNQGDYFISVGLASMDINGEVIPHDRRYDSIHITINNKEKFHGLVDLEAKLKYES